MSLVCCLTFSCISEVAMDSEDNDSDDGDDYSVADPDWCEIMYQ